MRFNTPTCALAAAAFLMGVLLAAAQSTTESPAAERATFFEGSDGNVWASAKDCVVYRRLPRNDWTLYTAPDYFTAEGAFGWEYGCTFTNVRNIEPETKFGASLACEDPEGAVDITPFEVTFEGDYAFVEYPDDPETTGDQLFNCARLVPNTAQ